jgi:hypothetical protein
MAHFDIELARHEAKYIVPSSLLPQIRKFIRPFCQPDPHTSGTPPEYTITTLQLDSPHLDLHYAKEREAINRFKLRVRTYGRAGEGPVFLEVKRKLKGRVVKSRCRVPAQAWSRDLVFNPRLTVRFKNAAEEENFLEFRRLVWEIGACPTMLIRYIRESYTGLGDYYTRVTFDRQLEYQPSASWESWGREGDWLAMDSAMPRHGLGEVSGLVMELKSLKDVPVWMLDLVMEFGLQQTGNCKYSTAVWHEDIFHGCQLPSS